MSIDIFSKENRAALKDRDLAILQQEKSTQVLHSLAPRTEERPRQTQIKLEVEKDFKSRFFFLQGQI